jgi:hypothetical protein
LLAKMAAKALVPGMPVDAQALPGAPMAKPEPAFAPSRLRRRPVPGRGLHVPDDPEIRRRSGDCPFGMALEPVAPTEATGPDPGL